MANSGSDKELMRETVSTLYAAAKDDLNTVFSIIIPEGYALELHACEFILGSQTVANIYSFFLVDDPDEIENPGHTAEKVLASGVIQAIPTVGVTKLRSKHDCHKQLLVNPPNFITNVVTANWSGSMFCRIWFDFIKISPSKILELLRQQQT